MPLRSSDRDITRRRLGNQLLLAPTLTQPAAAFRRSNTALALVGGWKRALSKTTVVVELSLVAGLRTTERKAVVAAARSFGRFLELPVELRGVGGRG